MSDVTSDAVELVKVALSSVEDIATNATALLEGLARPQVRSETEDFEASAAALARDMAEIARKVRKLREASVEEMARIVANGGTYTPRPAPSLKLIPGGADATAE